jgi:hypothetical protein
MAAPVPEILDGMIIGIQEIWRLEEETYTYFVKFEVTKLRACENVLSLSVRWL